MRRETLFTPCRIELGIEGVNDFEKAELMKVGIARTYPSYAMFAHKNGGVRVVDKIAGKMRHFDDHIAHKFGVAERRCENG